MKKIALIGGAGMTELGIVETAAKRGAKVWTLSRNPSSMHEKLRSQVEVITGNMLVKEDVEKVVKGSDAVIVTLGTVNEPGRYMLSPIRMMPDILKNIFWAMERNNVKLVVVSLSCFLLPLGRPMPLEFQDIHKGHKRMAQVLKLNNSLDWIGVVPPFTARTPADFTVVSASAHGQPLTKYDVGRFLVDCLTEPNIFRIFSALDGVARNKRLYPD